VWHHQYLKTGRKTTIVSFLPLWSPCIILKWTTRLKWKCAHVRTYIYAGPTEISHVTSQTCARAFSSCWRGLFYLLRIFNKLRRHWCVHNYTYTYSLYQKPGGEKTRQPKNKKEKFFRSNGNKKTREARKKGSVDYWIIAVLPSYLQCTYT
jgi:hypothetical protein